MSTDTTSPILEAARIVGSRVALARLLGVTKGAVWQWEHQKSRVPAKHCPTIERATAGAVRCEDLRPDVDWAYLRGSASQTRPAASEKAA